MYGKAWIASKAVLTILLAFVAPVLSGCNVNKTLTTEALGQQVDYINFKGAATSGLEHVSKSVWTYRWFFDRTLVIDTRDGLVVVDSFSPQLTTHLLKALRQAGINKPVHTLIYTHYHMDHTRGGSVLAPRNVICHERCQYWWSKFPKSETDGVLRPTRIVQGDTKLTIGGIDIQLVYLANAHTDTNLAVLVPSERVLFASDTVAIRSLLPSGGVSIFMPDYLKALDRLDALDFDHFVSSHFSWGTKKDFHEAVQMQRDSWNWIRQAIDQAGAGRDGEGLPLINDRKAMQEAYGLYYEQMKKKYGDWHGFDAQILPTFLNGFVAYYVGT